MPNICSKDPTGKYCDKDNSAQGPTDTELWLKMMSSMLNYAAASTNLLKSIQSKMIEFELKKVELESFGKQVAEEPINKVEVSFLKSSQGGARIPLLTEQKSVDSCDKNKCVSSYKSQESVEKLCNKSCCGKNLPSKLPVPVKKKEVILGKEDNPIESSTSADTSCCCKPKSTEDPVIQVIEPEARKQDSTPSDNPIVKPPCQCTDDSNENADVSPVVESITDKESDQLPPCCCSRKDQVENEKVVEKNVIPQIDSDAGASQLCAAFRQAAVSDGISESCSCTSLTKVASVALDAFSTTAEDCECQTDSSDDLMGRELRLASLDYQMKQTEANLKKVKNEMNRISVCAGGGKRGADEIVQLYKEIMKPRTSVSQVIPRREFDMSNRRHNRSHWL